MTVCRQKWLPRTKKNELLFWLFRAPIGVKRTGPDYKMGTVGGSKTYRPHYKDFTRIRVFTASSPALMCCRVTFFKDVGAGSGRHVCQDRPLVVFLTSSSCPRCASGRTRFWDSIRTVPSLTEAYSRLTLDSSWLRIRWCSSSMLEFNAHSLDLVYS